MPDWTKSMQQRYEYYIVDPNNWCDSEKIEEITSCSIERDSSVETLGSASFDIIDTVGEAYIRAYLVTIQNGITERFPLGTFLAQTPSSKFDGKIRNSSMDAYTPLIELKEKKPPLGYYIRRGENVMEWLYRLSMENMRAPVVGSDSFVYSTPKCIVGNDLTNGRCVVSIVRQYYSSTSAETITGGSWSSIQPSSASENTIFTRYKLSWIGTENAVEESYSTPYILGSNQNYANSIITIAEQYYSSTSLASPAGGTWSSIKPVWVSGKYIWTKSNIKIYGSNDMIETNPIMTSVYTNSNDYVDVEYAKTKSDTIPPTTGWFTTAPVWEEGTYIWERTKTIRREFYNKTLFNYFVADTEDTWLTYLRDLASRADHNFDIDEMGRIFFSPIQETESLTPVWTYNVDDESILYPEITTEHDLYGIPNVVEVAYSTENSFIYSRVVNDDPNSQTSTVNRGREIIYRDTNPSLVGELINGSASTATQTLVDEYAKTLLKSLSSIEYTISYTHGYCPVRLGDCVCINYPSAGLKNVKAKVISQSIKCEPGCPVSEKAVFTEKFWG